MLHGIPLQVTLSCPSCHQPVHVQGLGESEVCAACTATVQLPVEVWCGWFGAAEIAEALTLPNGEARQIASLGAASAKYAYGHRMPRCQQCHTDVPPGDLPALARAGGFTCGCGEKIRVREASDLAKVVVPGARWLVNEGATGSDGAEPQAATEPALFQCMGCGGALEVDGTSRNVKCRFCGASNYLPDGLWLRLHPPRTVRTFFVVLDQGAAGEVPVALLQRLASSDDSDARASAAANPALPLEVLRQLASDDDYDVRRALACNPALPDDVVEQLVHDEDDDVREALVRSGRLSPALLVTLADKEDNSDVCRAIAEQDPPAKVLEALAHNEYWGARAAAARHPRTPQAALAKLANDIDSDVMDGLRNNPSLGPDVLRALAKGESHRAREIAAGHPAAPADALVALAADHDSDVQRALIGNPSLPAQAVLALAAPDNTVSEQALQHPLYLEAASKRRRRRLTVGAVLVSLLLCVGAGTGGLGALALAARWAARHLL